MFDSRETVWISASIAILIVILLGVRSDVLERFSANKVKEATNVAVVVPKEGQTTEDAVVEALAKSASLQGDLKELVAVDITVGVGAVAETGKTITVHYAGNTQDGVQVDNSYESGKPYTFVLGDGSVIEGWEKGIPGMQVGGKRALIIPARMAYGSRQVGPVPPHTPLVYVVELLEVR